MDMSLLMSDDDLEFSQDMFRMVMRELKATKQKMREMKKQVSVSIGRYLICY